MTNEMKELTAAFEEWIGFCESLDRLDHETWESSLEPGKWTIKSIVAHMMLWDRYFYEEAIHKIATGEKITLVHQDFDEFNSKAIAYGNRITTEALLEDAIAYRRKILAAIRSLTEEQAEYQYVDGDGNVFQVKQYLKDFIWHDQHHVRPVAKFLEAKGIM